MHFLLKTQGGTARQDRYIDHTTHMLFAFWAIKIIDYTRPHRRGFRIDQSYLSNKARLPRQFIRQGTKKASLEEHWMNNERKGETNRNGLYSYEF